MARKTIAFFGADMIGGTFARLCALKGLSNVALQDVVEGPPRRGGRETSGSEMHRSHGCRALVRSAAAHPLPMFRPAAVRRRGGSPTAGTSPPL